MKKEKENELFSGEGNIGDFKVHLQSYGGKISEFQNEIKEIEQDDNEKKITFFGPLSNSEIAIDDKSYDLEKSKAMQVYQMASNNDKVHFFLLKITLNNNEQNKNKKLPIGFLKKVYKNAAQKDPLNDNLAIDNISTIADTSNNIFYVFFTAQDEKSGYQASQLLRSITDLRFKKERK